MEVYDLTKLIEILVGVAVGLSNIIIGLSVYKLSIISFSHQGVLPEWKKNNLVAILELKRNILESKLNIGFFVPSLNFIIQDHMTNSL